LTALASKPPAEECPISEVVLNWFAFLITNDSEVVLCKLHLPERQINFCCIDVVDLGLRHGRGLKVGMVDGITRGYRTVIADNSPKLRREQRSRALQRLLFRGGGGRGDSLSLQSKRPSC
jgi:hypothetical protein